MTSPTAAEIKALLLNTDWNAVSLGDDDVLQSYVDSGTDRVMMVTGWTLDTVPVSRERLMTRTIGLTAIFLSARENLDVLETAGDYDILTSFTAGSYSESRRDLAGKNSALTVLCPWPPLAEGLWDLMTPPSNESVEGMREYWMSMMTGATAPHWTVQEVDWSGDAIVDWYAPWQRGM